MSLVLIGKDLLLEAKQRTNGFQVYIYIYKYKYKNVCVCDSFREGTMN